MRRTSDVFPKSEDEYPNVGYDYPVPPSSHSFVDHDFKVERRQRERPPVAKHYPPSDLYRSQRNAR